MKYKKLGLKILGAGVLIFIIYNILWAANLYFVYYPYTENIPKHESGIYHYYNEKDDLSYNVKMPSYLYFTGNLGVSDNAGSGLIVWPGKFGTQNTYGLRVKSRNKTYEILINEDGKVLSEYKDQEEVVAENKEKIKEFFDEANRLWNLSLSIE